MSDSMNPAPRKKFAPYPWTWLGVSALVIVLDWITKQRVSEALELYRPQEVLSWLNITLAHNYGAAFSFLSDAGGWQRWLLTAISLGMSIFIIIWITKLPKKQMLLRIALALILGGAVGNLYDRAMVGYVVDFISLYFMEYRFATFNIADAAISVGAAMIVLETILDYRRSPAVE